MNDIAHTTDAPKPVSSLPEKDQRWLSKFAWMARSCQDITNDDLLTLFPPQKIFEAYADEPESRARLLTKLFNFGVNTAKTLDVSTCITLFDRALAERDLTADQIFEIVTPDEIVRVLDRKLLWDLVRKTRWYERVSDAHRSLMAHALEDYVDEELGGTRVSSLLDLEKNLGFENYVKHLPPEILVEIIRHGRMRADGAKRNDASSPVSNMLGGIAFTADVLAEVATPAVLAKHLPLEVCYKVLEAAATAFGWVEPPKPAFEVPPPTKVAGGLPEGALDSVRPSAPPEPDATAAGGGESDGDPEVSIGGSPTPALELDGEDVDDLFEEEDEKKAGDGASARPPSLPPSGSKKKDKRAHR